MFLFGANLHLSLSISLIIVVFTNQDIYILGLVTLSAMSGGQDLLFADDGTSTVWSGA